MKKKDILKIMKLGLNIYKFDMLGELRFREINSIIGIDELSNEFNILDLEIDEFRTMARNATQNSDRLNCNHSIRFSLGMGIKCNRCILCQETFEIESDNYTLDYDTIIVPFSCYPSTDYGYTMEEMYEIINEILETKNDEEEIDIVNEISKLNLNNSCLLKSNIKKSFQKTKNND